MTGVGEGSVDSAIHTANSTENTTHASSAVAPTIPHHTHFALLWRALPSGIEAARCESGERA